MTLALSAGPLAVRRDAIDPSPTNPRKRFDEASLRELAATMTPEVGIIEPLVVRLSKKPGRYELVAGERRWRAAAIAKLEDVPVVVRVLTDEQVIEIQIIENEKRKDIHALEQSDAFVAWQKLNPKLTPKLLGERVGMSERWVQNLLHYQKLVPEVREAFYDNRITPGHADLIVRLSAADQKRALVACFEEVYAPAAIEAMKTGELFAEERVATRGGRKVVEKLASTRKLDDWIKGNIRLDVKTTDSGLLLPEVRDALKASDPVYNATPEPTLIEVADTWEVYGSNWKGPRPLTRRDWRDVEGKPCEFARRAVVVLGQRRGRLVDICMATGKCKKHWSETMRQEKPVEPGVAKPKQSATSEQAQREATKRRNQQQRDELLRKVAERALDALDPKIPKKPTPATLAIVLADQRSTWRELVSEAASNLLAYGQIAVDTAEKTKLFKTLGVDLNALFKAEGAAAAPKKPTPKGFTEKQKKAIHKLHGKLTKKAKPAKRKAGRRKK